DASPAVGTVSQLIEPARRAALDVENRKEQARLREMHAGKRVRPVVPIAEARANAPKVGFGEREAPRPPFVGRREIEVSLAELVPYVDWTFFFTAWELRGKFPQILEHAQYGQAARELYDAGKKLLDTIVREGALRARGVYGFWPAERQGEDIVLFTDEARRTELARFPMLRQQQAKTGSDEGQGPHLSLADFVAPKDAAVRDHVGAFAVTAGLGIDALVARFQEDHDDYHAIMAKALADRLAEAFAELLPERVRKAGYAPDEALTNEDRISEKYRGIRPALGYPACPDHTQKRALFRILEAEKQSITLTES